MSDGNAESPGGEGEVCTDAEVVNKIVAPETHEPVPRLESDPRAPMSRQRCPERRAEGIERCLSKGAVGNGIALILRRQRGRADIQDASENNRNGLPNHMSSARSTDSIGPS